VGEQSSRYQCPMHPSVVQDHPGDCPICGMRLVKAELPAATAPDAGERIVRFYRSPMNPRETSPTPRQDEMGMDYLPVYEDEVHAAAPVPGLATVDIEPGTPTADRPDHGGGDRGAGGRSLAHRGPRDHRRDAGPAHQPQGQRLRREGQRRLRRQEGQSR
jgi:hypothetical protein